MTRRTAALISVVALILWLPFSTPVAVLSYEYGGHNATLARVILLSKDVAAFAAFVGALFVVTDRPRLRWVDKAALLYSATVVVYSVIPLVSQTPASLEGVIASARQLTFPVVMYGLGRLVGDMGVTKAAARTVVWAGVAAAVAAEVVWALLPVDFLATRYDLVSFIREVQGFAEADNLWNISILGQYTEAGSLQFARAVGPFTHPVGLGHFLVLPLGLTFARGLQLNGRATIPWFLASAVLGLGLLASISRGSWAAGAIAVVVCAIAYRRFRYGALALVSAAVVIALVPPFALSLVSVASGSDPSTAGHVYAVQTNIDTYLDNPLGVGVGSADKFGAVDLDPNASPGPGEPTGPDSNAEGLGVGENLYLSLLINVGPLGLLFFGAWIIGAMALLLRRVRNGSPSWVVVATLAATLGYLASAMTSSPLFRFSSSGSYWLLLGIVVAMAIGSARTEAVTPARQPIE
jgi:hypothetical protein